METEAASHHACASCGAGPGVGKFCPHCGEAATHDGDLALSHLTHDFVHEFVHLDGKIWRTLFALLAAPGKLTKEYWEGRRGLWVRPLRLYLVISALQVLFAASSAGPLGLRIWAWGEGEHRSYRVGSQVGSTQRGELIDNEMSHRIQTIYLWVRYVGLAFTAGAAWLMYRRRQPYFGAQVIFGLHFYSFEYLLNGFTAKIPFNGLAIVTSFVGMAYLFLTLRRLYGLKVLRAALHTIGLFIVVSISEGIALVGALLIALKMQPH